LNGRLGGVQVTASQLSYSAGVFTASFDANGPVTGIAGFTRGTLAARGKVTAGDDLVLDISGQFANLRQGAIRLDLVSFDADAKDNKATLVGRAKGLVGAPIDLAINASGNRTASGWSGTATLEGSVDKLPVSSSRPATWSYGEAGWSIDSSLSAFGGSLDAKLADGDAGASADLDVVGLDLRTLSQLARISQINGRVTGQATFSNAPGVMARGNLHLGVSGVNPVGVSGDPVMLSIDSQLRDGAMITQASGTGQGFDLKADSTVLMSDGERFNVLPNRNAAVVGHLNLTGRA